MKKLFATIAVTFVLLATTFLTASAQVQLNPDLHPDYAPVVSLGTQAGPADYGNYFLQLIAGGLLYLAGPIAILVIAIAGLRYVTSHGEQNAMEGAKKTLEFAIIGLIVIMLSYAAVRAVIGILLQTDVSPPQTVTSPASSPTPSPSASPTPAPAAPAPANPGYDPNQPSI